MVRIKSQLKMFDVMVGIFYSQLRYPTLLLWFFILGMNFYHQCLPLILAGSVLSGLVLFLIYVLRLAAVILLVGLFFTIVGKLTGSLKNQFLLQEYTLEGNTILDKAGEKESKTYLDDIQLVYEDKKRFMLFKTGFKFEVISKRLMTETELEQSREFFKTKTSVPVHYIFKFLPCILLILASVTAIGLFVPNYYKISSVQNMVAFYQEDELAISICIQSEGNSDDLYDGIFPPTNRKVVRREPFFEMHFFDIKKGELTQLTLTGHEYLQIYPSGQNIFCVTRTRKGGVITKFDGKQFVPVTAEERTALANKPELTGSSDWSMFRLWDENDREIEEHDPLKGEDDWATFFLKSGSVQIHYRTSITDPKTNSTQYLYSVKGLISNGGEQDLLSVIDGVKKIDSATFEDNFPVKITAGSEGAQ